MSGNPLYLLCAFTILFSSCSSPDPDLFGKWRVQSEYYQAVYHIVENEGKIEGRVLYYNDGTTLIPEGAKTQKFLFRNLQEHDDLYVDGITGATTGNDRHWSLRLKHRDTIEALEHFGEQSSSELWIRIKEMEQ